MKAKFLFILFVSALLVSCKNHKEIKIEYKEPEAFDLESAGVIEIYDPFRYFVGETDSLNSVYEISLADVGKYHGKVCPGIVAGFFMFKDVLKELYPAGEIPQRGQIAVVNSRGSDLLDVAGYIFGVRSRGGFGERPKGLIFVDTTLRTGVNKQMVLIFKRLDNGKQVKVIFNKRFLMPQDTWDFIDEIKHKFEQGKPISAEEYEKFHSLVQGQVKNFLTEGVPSNVYEISEDTTYKFPF